MLAHGSFFLRTCSFQEGQFCSRAQGYFKRRQSYSLLKYSSSCARGSTRRGQELEYMATLFLNSLRFARPYSPRGTVLFCVFLFTPLCLQVGLAALLWGAKAPVVANNAPPRCRRKRCYGFAPSPRQRVEELFAIFAL